MFGGEWGAVGGDAHPPVSTTCPPSTDRLCSDSGQLPPLSPAHAEAFAGTVTQRRRNERWKMAMPAARGE